MTKLEKIRQMSDEELADKILYYDSFYCDHCAYKNTAQCGIKAYHEEYRKTGVYPVSKERAICLNGIKSWLNS